jgi:PAS domain S-box-containing protein/putative nucleotidyltransferase with HDIG domain
VHVPLTDASGEVIGVEVRAFDATDRQAIETALWESEGRYRDLFDSAVEGIAETSMEGNCLRANEAVAKMLGYGSAEEAAAEIVDSAHQVWADPDERSRFAELIRSQGTVLGYECRFVRKDGERIWVSLKSRSVPGLDGEATYYKSFVEDITERKRVEDALRKSEAHYRRIFETAAEGICVMGSDHRMTLVNRRMADMLGYEPADIVGKKVESFMFEEDLPAHQEPMTERQAGLDGTYEHRFRRSDGSILLTNVSATVLTDGPGDFAGSFAMFTDITERKRAEDLLRRSEVMRNVAEHVARTGSWRWDLDPTGFSWSEELFELFDVDPDEFDGDVISALAVRIHADDVDSFMRARAAGLETGEAPAVEFRVVHRDGSEHVLYGESTAERDETGKAVAIVGYFQDVTDRHKMAARLETAAAEWRETFDAMGDSVSLFDADGRIVRCNAATVALTGRDFGDIIGHYCQEVFHDPDYAYCPRKRAFKTGQVETDIIERDGAWLRITFTPEIDGAGHAVGGVHVVTDITQLRQAEQAAAERSHFLEELLEAIPVPVFCLDATLRYIDENEAYAVTSGHSKGEVIGKTAFDVWPAELAKSFDASDRELLAHPERPVEEELELSDPDGTQHWLVTHKAVFSDVAGKPAGIVGVNLDVTEIRRAEQEIAASAAQLALTLEGSVAALGATTELRDPYTAGHQRRVAELACAIALELGWDEARRVSLRIGALLHDIGKIILPAEILAKPGRLSETEMQLIRQHAAAGADVVGSIGFERNVAEMIRQHHERLDGSGYPAGLRDGEILPEARILAVADVVEAMISHRPYRPALPIEVAMAELEDGAGTRYDAAACETAISLIREQGFTFGK